MLQDYILSGLTEKYENIVTQHMFTDIPLAKTEELLREFDQLLVNNSLTPAIELPPGETGYSAVETAVARASRFSKGNRNKTDKTCFNCGNYGHLWSLQK